MATFFVDTSEALLALLKLREESIGIFERIQEILRARALNFVILCKKLTYVVSIILRKEPASLKRTVSPQIYFLFTAGNQFT